MKNKLIFTLLALFGFFSANAQGGDDGLLEKCFIDSKTGDTIIKTKWTRVNYSSKFLLNFRMTRIDSEFTFDLSYHFGPSEPFTVAKGDSVWIKFFGGMKVVLYSKASAQSDKGAAMTSKDLRGATVQGIKVQYIISKTQLLGFAGNEIEKIRIFSSKGYKDILWPKPYQDELSPLLSNTVQAARLLLENRKQFIVAKPDPEDLIINKEDAKKDEF
jgi:hypothetical protein